MNYIQTKPKPSLSVCSLSCSLVVDEVVLDGGLAQRPRELMLLGGFEAAMSTFFAIRHRTLSGNKSIISGATPLDVGKDVLVEHIEASPRVLTPYRPCVDLHVHCPRRRFS